MSTDKPKPSEDDFLDDLNIDDLDDFDSFLDEDTKVPPAGQAKPSEKKGAVPDASASEALASAGDDDILGDFEELSEDDLLDSDDLLDTDTANVYVVAEEEGATGGDGGFSPASDDAEDLDISALLDDTDAGALPDASEESPGAADDDDASRFLADEGDGDEDLDALVNDSADEPEADDDLGVEDVAAAAMGAAAASVAAASAEDEEPEEKGAKKGAKRGPGKGARAGKKGGARSPRSGGKSARESKTGAGRGARSGKSSTRDRSRKSSVAARAAEKSAPVKIRGALQFICSECYAEFNLPSSFSSETLTCPECLHIGKRPDEGFLRTVIQAKAKEKSSFTTAVAVGVALFVIFGFLIWLRSDYCTLELAADQKKTWTLGLLGGGGVLTLVFFYLLARFEKNRWDVYF